MRGVPSSSTSCREHHDDDASTPAIGLPSNGKYLVSRLLPAAWYSVRFTAPAETGTGALPAPCTRGVESGANRALRPSTGRCALLPRWSASPRRRVFHVKATTRRLLAEHGVRSALSCLAESPDQAVKTADRLGYRVVVKPRGHAGSAGVLRADTDDDVRAAVDRALTDSVLGLEDRSVPGALVEQYTPGPEISVEAVVLDNPEHVRIAAGTLKSLGPEPVPGSSTRRRRGRPAAHRPCPRLRRHRRSTRPGHHPGSPAHRASAQPRRTPGHRGQRPPRGRPHPPPRRGSHRHQPPQRPRHGRHTRSDPQPFRGRFSRSSLQAGRGPGPPR
ncbi:acetyl-CoA carboxylase biotin carboxylase subunit family protein [Streptomyces sp. NPDC090499]|uniref:ATP-grasp domain-containing protein n=1 Tax=Streptomyces sp. NPDC090499 TaxID=3365965 RepID=UPI0037FE425E